MRTLRSSFRLFDKQDLFTSGGLPEVSHEPSGYYPLPMIEHLVHLAHTSADLSEQPYARVCRVFQKRVENHSRLLLGLRDQQVRYELFHYSRRSFIS